jgi:diphthine methyl ester acylhydrolase
MSLRLYDTVWPADSVEFCPHPDAADILVCGTYNLEHSETNQAEAKESTDQSELSHAAQLRRGKCLLLAVDQSSQSPTTTEDIGYTL